MNQYVYEQYLHQKTIKVNVCMKVNDTYLEQLFELIYARCVTSNYFPGLSSTILTLEIPNPLKTK
jgi:hypothetical protein